MCMYACVCVCEKICNYVYTRCRRTLGVLDIDVCEKEKEKVRNSSSYEVHLLIAAEGTKIRNFMACGIPIDGYICT